MKHILTALLCLGLTAPLMAAGKKPAAAKPAAEEKKPAAETKASAKSEAEAKSLTAAEKTKLMKVINEGDDKAVKALPDIGDTRAAAIKKARPFSDVLDLLKVDGIGEGIFSQIIAYTKAGMPEPAKKPAAAATDDKSKAKSTKKKSS